MSNCFENDDIIYNGIKNKNIWVEFHFGKWELYIIYILKSNFYMT